MRLMIRWVLLGLTVAPFLATGCSKAPPAAVPVEAQGTLTTEAGKPIEGLILRFHSQDAKNAGGSAPTCVSKENGTFDTKCLPGKYKVTVLGVPVHHGDSPSGGTIQGTVGKSKVTIPSEYGSPTKTPLEVEISNEGNRNVVFKVKAR